jgi:hypothetical protein
MDYILKIQAECVWCLGTIEPNSQVYVHDSWTYCNRECLNEQLKLDIFYAWVVFKNCIDLYNGEELLGVHTLVN